MSVSQIANIFFRIEEKYNLNYQKIQGCYAWQLIRIYLYYEITRRTGIFGSPQQKSLSLSDKIKSFIPFFKNSLLSNPLSGKYTKDILIFDHPRKVFFEGEYRDIYSYFLKDYIDEDDFEVLESPYFNNHLTDKKDYIKYTDRIELGSYIYKKFNKIEFTPFELKLISNVKKDIQNAFNLKIDLEEILKMHILNFQYDYNAYKKLFSKRKCKKIFVVVGYENQAIIGAAKDLGIEVIELQHGTITDYHLGYSYPPKTRSKGDIAYYPDKILTFGEYWINEENSPISKENIIPIGFSYFESQSKEFMNLEAISNQVLFISQGVIGKDLSKIAYEFARKMPDYSVIYKLHPGEYETWRENYPLLTNDLINFKVIDNSQIPLYELFARSNFQVGAFSTAIYEGLMFDCKTFIVNISGVEYVSDLIKKGYVLKINNINDLIDNLERFQPEEYDNDFFFKNFDEDLLKSVIDDG